LKKDYCHIVAIIDRSGSMGGLENEVIGGFNKFVSDQKEAPGTATLSLIQFDNEYEVNYEFIDIQNVPDLNGDTYIPRGMTAMYDAIGKAITSTGKKLSEMNENDRPDKVIILIQTDGMENASHEYNSQIIKNMIKEQEEKYSWSFVFLGANINAKVTASIIGINKKMSMTFAANSQGMTSAFNSVSENLTAVRGGFKGDMSYENKDYTAQSNAGVSQ
jgi:uncharacterized protein YegL